MSQKQIRIPLAQINPNMPYASLLRKILYVYGIHVVIIVLSISVYLSYFGYGQLLTSAIPLFTLIYAVTVGLPLTVALLPNTIVSIFLHARNYVSRWTIYASLARIALFAGIAWWFSDNFNRGPLTHSAIQAFAVLIICDILYHTLLLARIRHALFTTSAIVYFAVFAWTLRLVPWNDLIKLNWSTLQDTPAQMFVYYLVFLFLYAFLASLSLFFTRKKLSS